MRSMISFVEQITGLPTHRITMQNHSMTLRMACPLFCGLDATKLEWPQLEATPKLNMTLMSCSTCFVDYHKTGVAPDWSHCILLHPPWENALNVMPMTFKWPTELPCPLPEGGGGRMTLNWSYSAFSHSGTTTTCARHVK